MKKIKFIFQLCLNGNDPDDYIKQNGKENFLIFFKRKKNYSVFIYGIIIR